MNNANENKIMISKKKKKQKETKRNKKEQEGTFSTENERGLRIIKLFNQSLN
jgi:hypothetical protein